MATAANVPLTPEEYLERERKAEFRSEFFRGQDYCDGVVRAGATDASSRTWLANFGNSSEHAVVN